MDDGSVAVGFVSVEPSSIKGKDRDINSLVKKFRIFLLGVPSSKNFIFFSRSPWSPEKCYILKNMVKSNTCIKERPNAPRRP